MAQLAQSARAEPQVDWRLFEFTVDVAMLTRREQHIAGIPGLAPSRPAVRVWLDPNAPSAVAAPLAVPQARPTRLSRRPVHGRLTTAGDHRCRLRRNGAGTAAYVPARRRRR